MTAVSRVCTCVGLVLGLEVGLEVGLASLLGVELRLGLGSRVG